MSRARFALVLASLVFLAGCGGMLAPGPDGTPTRTVTPAPLPVETATPGGPSVLAPGLSTDGVFDAGDLADAHVAALEGVSFTVVREERRTYTNGSFRSRYRSVVRMSAAADRFRYGLNQTDRRDGRLRHQRLERYADGSVVYVAITREDETTYSILGGPERPVEPSTVFPDGATARFGVARLFGSLRLDVVDRRVADGRTAYAVAVENGSQALGGLRNVSMNATVRSDGLVTDYRLAYEVGDIRVTVVVEFERVGETEVTPPSWLPAALNGTGATTVGDGTPTQGGATATDATSGATATDRHRVTRPAPRAL
jgi:hypothetical protein